MDPKMLGMYCGSMISSHLNNIQFFKLCKKYNSVIIKSAKINNMEFYLNSLNGNFSIVNIQHGVFILLPSQPVLDNKHTRVVNS